MYRKERTEIYELMVKLQPNEEDGKSLLCKFGNITPEERELLEEFYGTKDRYKIYKILCKYWNCK